MKKNKLKKLSIFALTTALTVSCLAGCGKKKEEDTEQATITTEAAATMSDADIEFAPTKEGYVINEFSGEWIDESLSNQRPLCIMINNIVDAMPQSGISQADIIYEMLVEGGITRYMCVFKDYSNLEKLGPVRSARHYYVQMANMLGGIYAHVGWSVYAESWIKDTGLNNLNGLYDSTTFYRDESRVAPHNCYTNSEKLKEGIAAAGYSTEYLGEKSKAFAFNVEDTALGSVENHHLKTILVPCKYGKEILEKQNILSHITVSNVSDDLLLSDLKSIKDIMNKELASTIDHFLSNTSKKGLFICGPSGCGKSTLAGFLTRSLAKQGYHLGYVHFPTYLIDLKNSFSEFGNDNNIEELRNVDYLVIDDLGGENVTSWSRDEVLAAVLTYRNQNKKITLFTSQYTQDDLIKIYTLKKDAREKIKVERLLNTIFTMSMPIMIKQ